MRIFPKVICYNRKAHRQVKKIVLGQVSYSITTYFSDFKSVKWLYSNMKVGKPDNFELLNSLLPSFSNVRGLHSEFVAVSLSLNTIPLEVLVI